MKKLENIKSRLSTILTSSQRRELNVNMLKDVVNALKKSKAVSQIIAVSADENLFKIVKNLHVKTLKESFEQGVNAAVACATDYCIKNGATAILILPSDIPLLSSEDVATIVRLGKKSPSIVLSPSIRFDGTNALLLNPPNIIMTHYDQDSFNSHLNEAAKKKISARVYMSSRVMLDLDTPVDVKEFLTKKTRSLAYKYLKNLGINRIKISRKEK
jgi:2-phospho-L-lactate guanylyltransferase